MLSLLGRRFLATGVTLVALAAVNPQSAFSQEPLDLDLDEVVFGYSSLPDSSGDAPAGYMPKPVPVVDTADQLGVESLPPAAPAAPIRPEAAYVEAGALCTCSVCGGAMHDHHHRRSGVCCPVVGPFARHWHYETKPWLQAKYWGYPEYFCERPFGTYARHAEAMQITNGLQDLQVLYHYDFLTDGDATILSPRGRYQLAKIARRMGFAPGPIVVEQSVDQPGVDAARRQNVLDALADLDVPVVPEMVVVARAPTPGMLGTEGLLIYQNRLQQTQQRGAGITRGSSSGTSFGNVGVGAGAAR